MVYALLNSCIQLGSSMYSACRSVALCLCLVIGPLLIGQLWVTSLNLISLSEAARGTFFLLVGLGLMGHRRLSLALSALLCLPAFLGQIHPLELSLIIICQAVLIGLSLILLALHSSSSVKKY